MNNYYENPIYQEKHMNNQPNLNFTNLQQSTYMENIIKSNIGKKISLYVSFPDSIEWRDKIFKGTLESAGTDYILISDENNTPILLQSIYVNFIKFENN